MKKQIPFLESIARPLTEVEFELMNILWKIEEGSVSDVMNHLPQDRNLAYTSVSTILRILEQKKILHVRKEGRGHIYIPTLMRAVYEVRTVHDVVDRVFAGAPTELVRQLLSSRNLTDKELKEIKKLVADYGLKK